MAGTLFEDNLSPYLTVVEQGSTPSNPAAGKQKLFVRTSDHVLCYLNSSGTVTPVASGGGSGSITASGYTQNTAKLLGRSTASSGAIEEISVGSGLSLSGGSLSASGSSTPFGTAQAMAFPTSISGDQDDFTALSNWSEISAFDVREIKNSTIGHFAAKGASKDEKDRFTLGTSKAAAFDFRWWNVLPDLPYWSGAFDAYVDFAMKTSADGHIVGFRISPDASPYSYRITPVAGGTVVTALYLPYVPRGVPLSLRVTRDGSNNCVWYIGSGPGAVPVHRFVQTSDAASYNGTPSGTIARSEILIHTPSGPGSSAEFGVYLDLFESV